MKNERSNLRDRREFLRDAALFGGAACAAAGSLGRAFAQGSDFVNHIGLELFTVRDAMTTPADYEAVLARLASFGYKEIEPASGYAGLNPKDFRAMIDRYGLTCPSTHSGLPAGDTIERRLEGAQVMGLLYVENFSGGAGAPAPAPRPAGGRGAGPTEESIKREAQTLNENGKVARKFGIKMIVHNHTGEFAPLADKPDMKPYDVLLAETDPALVTLQLDIGWASVAGQDILGMFKKHPGRFECWHVKDAMDMKLLTPEMTQSQRQQAAKLVPVGLGDVDYKSIFAAASQAGMKHFCIEQDNANQWGDSLAAARVSLQGLKKMLS